MGLVGAGNPFSPNNSSTVSCNKTDRGEIPHKYSHKPRTHSHSHIHKIKFRRCMCVRAQTGNDTPIAASPNHTDNILDFTFFCSHSSRLVWYVMHFFTFFPSLFLSSLLNICFLICQLFPSLLFFFLLGTCCFPLDSLFLLLLLLLLLRPFSHAPPRLLIARNRCDFAHLYVFFFVLSSAHVFTRFVFFNANNSTTVIRDWLPRTDTHTNTRTHAATLVKGHTSPSS